MNNNEELKVFKAVAFGVLLYFIGLYYRTFFKLLSTIFSLLFPFILGFCIAFIFNIPMKFFENLLNKFIKRKNLNRFLSIIIVLLILITIIYIVFILIIPEIIATFSYFQKNIPNIINSISSSAKYIENNFNIKINFNEILNNISSKLPQIDNFLEYFSLNTLSNSLQSIFSVTNTVFNGVLTIFLGIIFSLYFLFEKEKLTKQSKRLIYTIFDKERAEYLIKVGKTTQSSFENFLAGQGKEAIILSLLFLTSMTLFRFPNSIAISTLIGIFSFIPIFGAFIVTFFGMLIISVRSPISSLWFLAMAIIIQQIEGNLIYPKIVGKSVGLPGLWVLFSVTVFGATFGVVGMIVCVPIASTLYILLGEKIDKVLSEKNINI